MLVCACMCVCVRVCLFTCELTPFQIFRLIDNTEKELSILSESVMDDDDVSSVHIPIPRQDETMGRFVWGSLFFFFLKKKCCFK